MSNQTITPTSYETIVKNALLEDLGRGFDITSDSLTDKNQKISAQIIARQNCTLAGLPIIQKTFELVDPSINCDIQNSDGGKASVGSVIATISGPASSILSGERTALNFLSHLSGVATQTQKYVEAVKGTKAKISATRKTLPGLRLLQKYAVSLGGGLPHRYGLDDAILVKDNHISVNDDDILKTIENVLAHKNPTTKFEIEVDTIVQLKEVIPFKPDIILLDNMSLEELKEAVDLVNGDIILEASGGVTLDTVSDIAKTGVDIISVGALTHSVNAIDFGLDI